VTAVDESPLVSASNKEIKRAASVVKWSEVLAAIPEVPGSILDSTKFSG
jgi:hypothetical protein